MTAHRVFIRLDNKRMQRIDAMRAVNTNDNVGHSSNCRVSGFRIGIIYSFF